MLEHTANLSQRQAALHARVVGDDAAGEEERQRQEAAVQTLQGKLETQGATVKVLLEEKKELLAKLRRHESKAGAAPLVSMGSLEQPQQPSEGQQGGEQPAGVSEGEAAQVIASLRQSLAEAQGRGDREAEAALRVRRELQGLHDDIGNLQHQLLEAQHANMEQERNALASVASGDETMAAQVHILEQVGILAALTSFLA